MSQRERILAVIDTAGPGGAEHALLTLLPALVRRGHECQLVALGPPYDMLPSFRERGIEAKHLETGGNREVAKASWNVAQLIGAYQPTVVHAHLFIAGLCVAATRFASHGAIRVVTFHNMAYSSYPVNSFRRTLRHRIDRLAMRWGMDGWIAVSRAVERHYSQALGLKAITVIHNGVDPVDTEAASRTNRAAVRERFDIQTGPSLILCAGRFRHEKGHRYLIAAMRELRCRGLTPTLVLAGTGPLFGPIIDDVNTAGVADQVRFAGHLTHEELMQLMAAADIVVVPSTHEGLSVTAAEALTLGKPVVASDTGGLPEVVEDGAVGLLVPPGDAEALADSIERLIRDTELRLRLGQSGTARAQEMFSAVRAAAAHEEFFRAVRNNRQSASAL